MSYAKLILVIDMNKIKNIINVKNLIYFFIVLFLFLTLDYFLLSGCYSLNIIDKSNKIVGITCIILKYIILIGIFIFQYHEYLKDKWIDFRKNFKKYFMISFKYWFLGFIIMILSNTIINYFFKGLGRNEENVQLLIKNIPLIAFFLTSFFAPIVEEMIFRKYLQDSIKNKTFYMIISGLLFGLVHVMGYDNYLEYLLIIPYGVLGFMFAKIINETDNIYNAIMMHMLHNGFLTLLAIWVV